MDNISALENDIEKKIRRINDFIVSNIPTEDVKVSSKLNDEEYSNKLELENSELKEQLTLLKNNHEKDLRELSEVINKLKILMEEADD